MKPILFNTEMVRAVLEGRKTVTRRVVRGKTWFKVDPQGHNMNFCPNCGTDMREPVADIDVGRKEEGGQT